MSVGDIYNFIEIDGSTATAGQPSEAQFRALRDAGYEVVVNLAPDGLETSLPDERGLLQFARQVLDMLLEAALIGQRETRPSAGHGLRDRPCERTFVGHAHNEAVHSGEIRHEE